jgi:hypothetical protein
MEELSPGVKSPVRVADHPTLSNAEIKNEWGYTSSHPIYIHGVHSNNFTVILLSTYMSQNKLHMFLRATWQLCSIIDVNIHRTFQM